MGWLICPLLAGYTISQFLAPPRGMILKILLEEITATPFIGVNTNSYDVRAYDENLLGGGGNRDS